MDDLKLSNYKSHDSHTIIQQLLGIAIRGVLGKLVRITVIRLCIFFNEICSKTIDVSRLPKIQNDIAETLCELEKYFPPSFFTIMVHLTLHLVREVELCGPVRYRWMYPFERYMKVCKGYVRNRARPEGCMAENYIAEEAVEFLAELLVEDKTAGIPSARDTVDRPASGSHVETLILIHCLSFVGNCNEHLEFLKQEFPRFRKDQKWLTDKQNKTFADWVKHKVADQMSESTAASLKDGFQISRAMNGVYLVADTPQVGSARDKRMIRDEMSFYGVIAEIWELDYEKFRIPIFKCDWVDNGRGVVVDELGFTLANLNKKGHFNDTFVLGKCVEKIFYIQDPADPQWVMAPSKKSTSRKSKKAASNKTAGLASATISTASKRKKSKNHEEKSEKGLKLLKRNCVAMKRISRSRSLKQKRVVQFNRTGTPYGKAATEMKSYIGVLARRKIPIVRTT
ncbi:PREDICTED: uncharacterized protein LOC101299550 [Fragaria vesca subsp. vesca]